MRVLFDTCGWADAVADLPAVGPLPYRTVIVFHERAAHALRRELVSTGRSAVLAGTRFTTPLAVAVEVLEATGVRFRIDDPSARVSRLARAFTGPLELRHFRRELLLRTGGWDEAFARTIHDLESAALRPADLRFTSAPPQLLDVATIWEADDALAGDAWTGPRVVGEAADVIARDPSRWIFEGPTLATLESDFTAGEARLATAIPGAQLALFAARPLRTPHLDRIASLLGSEAAEALRAKPFDAVSSAAAHLSTATERDVLAAWFLETPDALAQSDRPRSRGPDGTVQLEEHAGVEDELEATADWVARQVLEHRTPLNEIAVLVPRAEPYAALVAERIGRLGVGIADGSVAVFVAGGVPATTSAAGARVLAVLAALRSHLPVEAVAELLPVLRPADPAAHHLSRGRAYALAYAFGTAGGHAADPRGALTWRGRLAERGEQLEKALNAARGPDGAPAPEDALEARDLEGLLVDLRNIAPPLTSLSEIAGRVLDGAPLSELCPAIKTFLMTWVRLPVSDAGPLPAVLATALDAVLSDPELGAIAGVEALAFIEDTLRSIRLAGPRYGDPSVYVGTIQSAVGLPFQAVRVLGLAEGHWPSVARQDAVLPDALRSLVPGNALRTSADHPLSQLQALACVIRGARREVVLSTSRVDIDRSQREPSFVLLEAAAALARPAPKGEPAAPIPDLRVLRRDAFAPARRAADAFRTEWPVSLASWQSRVARHGAAPQATWFGAPALDLVHIRSALEHGAVAPTEGLLDPRIVLDLPGLTAERPISASGLHDLLQCPHKFLFERLLGWREPADAAPQREIDAMSYGSLFHEIAEGFFREHGEAFSARRGSLAAWRAEADVAAKRALGEFLETYPLLGDAVRAHQLARLRGDLGRFLEGEWNATVAPEFVAAEHSFGYAEPARVDAGGAELFVRGYIDRIDIEGERLMVRDLKTGRPHPRRGEESDAVALLDIQIGLYALVARSMAKARRLGLGAAYLYTGLHVDRERAFRDDIRALETATTDWLKVAEGLLRQRAFPRTPVKEDCRFCAFAPVCGDDFHPHVTAMLETHRRGPLRGLRVLKLGEDA